MKGGSVAATTNPTPDTHLINVHVNRVFPIFISPDLATDMSLTSSIYGRYSSVQAQSERLDSTDRTTNMKNRRLTRRVAATVGIAAALSAGVLTACGGGESGGPSSTTPTTTTSVSPTEKSISPTGGNLFTPTVKAPPAPPPVPGDH
jgi:hypothetical protein